MLKQISIRTLFDLAPAVLAVFAACGPAGEPQDPVAEEDGAITGVVTAISCTADEQALAQRAVEAGRFVAVSHGYRECLGAVMARSATLLHDGGWTSAGPYVTQSGDPYASSALLDKIVKAFYAANSTADVTFTCGTSIPDEIAHAGVGTWSETRQAPEEMTAGQGWRNLVVLDNGRNTALADVYQESHRRAANAIWHESSHQWGYRHAGGGWTPSLEQTIPYIAGDCMETVMQLSASCADSCAAGQRPVSHYSSAGCECVDNPAYDVGVVLASGIACPVMSGRDSASAIALHMDDEDSGNANSRGGWYGQITSDANTTFRFCAVPGRLFSRYMTGTSAGNYAVVRMGASCPAGSVSFARSFDNEDDSNANWCTGHVAPQTSGRNTLLEFCLFRSSASSGSSWPFPNLGIPYGVFAASNLPGALATGFVHTDDEDDSNANSVTGSYSGSEGFLTADRNTTLRLARVR